MGMIMKQFNLAGISQVAKNGQVIYEKIGKPSRE